MFSSKRAVIWLIILVGLCTLSGFQVVRHWKLQTDVLALLPSSEQDPAMRALRQVVSGALGRTALFLVGHETPEVARMATQQLGAWMADSLLFETVQWDYRQQQQAVYDLYFPLRYQVLSPAIREYLNTPAGYTRLLQRVRQALYQPTSSFATRFLETDPLLFFPALAQYWGQQSTQLRLQDGLLTRQYEGRFYHVITAQIAFNPFDADGQTQFLDQWTQWADALQRRHPNLELTDTSFARFAAATRTSIRRDIQLISILSLIGVVALTVGTFRTLTHLLLALVPLAAGIWSAIGLSLFWFGELHALTLAFGASLIGICIDYSFHYFAHHRLATHWHPTQAMRQILPALSLGALTTTFSYLGLALTPLVGLQQIAVFASCGIFVSFGTVVLWFPIFLRHPHPHPHRLPPLYNGAQWLFALWHRHRISVVASYALLTLISLSGLWSLRISDSPRALNALPPELAAKDRRIRTIMGTPANHSYLIVEGATAEAALQKLESFHTVLHAGPESPFVRLGPVLTWFLPSLQQQKKDRHASRALLVHRHQMTTALTQLGLPQDAIQNFLQTLQHDQDKWLRPEEWLQHDASHGLRHLWLGETMGGTALLVPIHHVNDLAALQAAIRNLNGGIYYLNQVEDFTRVFKRYRYQAMQLGAGAYLLIFLLLLWRYRARAVMLILPPLLAALITVGLLGLLGQPFHVMHCLALLLVLGMSVDYTIFVAESSPAARPATELALTLSALTTLLSFGLLSLSHQAVLQSIGLTALIGITVVLCLVPMARNGRTT